MPWRCAGRLRVSLALLFPGQGSQHVGMGRELANALPAARMVFQEADDILATALSRLMWEVRVRCSTTMQFSKRTPSLAKESKKGEVGNLS